MIYMVKITTLKFWQNTSPISILYLHDPLIMFSSINNIYG
jgi:hypothetical protein